MKDLSKKIYAWPDEPLYARMERARSLLAVHGMIGAKDSTRISARIKRAMGVPYNRRLPK